MKRIERGDSGRDRVLVATATLLVSLLAWAYLVRMGAHMVTGRASAPAMPGMLMPGIAEWRPTDFVLTFTMWAVMMVGMMGPSATPMLLFAASHARHANRRVSTVVLPFALGYLTTWSGFSAVATLGQWALNKAALLSSAMAVSSPRLAGALLVAAGVYQLTPAKRACLAHCETPMGFLMHHWREGAGGAYRMGVRHGLYCVGCCWALMVVLFAVGVMNLAWVAMLTVFILAERLGRVGAFVSRAGGVAMVGLGFVLIATRFLGA
jgi:predicted metal-binding membrane protein